MQPINVDRLSCFTLVNCENGSEKLFFFAKVHKYYKIKESTGVDPYSMKGHREIYL